VNTEFNAYLLSQPHLKHLVDAKFFICDGNYRRGAWMRHIQRLYNKDPKWHVSIDSIILDTKGRLGATMQVMHDINK